MSIEVTLVHVSLLGNASHEYPQTKHNKDALPHGIGDLIPHLLIEEVNLLESLEVVDARGCVCDGPHSEVVHVRHH